MLTKRDVLSQAADECMKELYSLAQPSIKWEDFIEENKKYIEKENKYYSLPKESRPDYREYMGPKPYEFYYLPKEVMKEICNSYVYAYKIDDHQNLLDIIKILKDYCEKPIVDKYIEGELREDGTRWPGHRGYDHPDNLEKELRKILREKAGFSVTDLAIERLSKEVYNKFFEFLDMAGEFFDWNGDLNSFNTCVYLGASPNSNKEAVIKNWKEYRNQDIKIDESKYKDDDYD